DEPNISLTRENWEALSPFARGGVYVNDLEADEDERVRDVYGSTKFERLVALKDRWDPDNTFHLNANITPAAT
ncbi:BBE domain-containing protein, partial [Klebsiella pneumoniae]